VTLERVGIFADGVAVRRVGEETFRLAQQHVDEVARDTDEICRRDQDIFEDNRDRGAGRCARRCGHQALRCENCRDRTLVAVNGGANINFDRLRHVASAPTSARSASCSPS
jgi:threonine dehydratase